MTVQIYVVKEKWMESKVNKTMRDTSKEKHNNHSGQTIAWLFKKPFII